MDYLYGSFTGEQIKKTAQQMHNDVHRLLLYKDKKIEEKIFENDEEFLNYYKNLLYRFGGMNTLLKEPPMFVYLISTLQAGYNDVTSDDFQYTRFRKAILDCHGYIKAIFEEGLICRP